MPIPTSVPEPFVYNATLLRVVDGDTCWLTVDYGFRGRLEIDFRLAGINCPDKRAGAAWYDPEKAAQAKQVAYDLMANRPLRITSEKPYHEPTQEKWRRWLAWIWTDRSSDGTGWTLVQQELLDAGLARIYGLT